MGAFSFALDGGMNIAKMMHAEEMQNDAQGFNRQEAIDQREWTERMSNTQYQRAASDASAAGLNRILAIRQGGNSAGGGATASSSASPSGSIPMPFNQHMMNSAQTDLIKTQDRKEWYQGTLNSQLYNESQARTGLINEQYQTQQELTTQARHQATILSNSAKGSALEGEIDTTTYGNIMRYIDRAVRGITGAGSAYRNFEGAR